MNKTETVSHCRLLIHLISFLQLDSRIEHTEVQNFSSVFSILFRVVKD